MANTIEECKHTEDRKRPINASSLGLINYLKKETWVWGLQRNLIRTRFITQSLYPHSLPPSLQLFTLLSSSLFTVSCVPRERMNNLLPSCRGQRDKMISCIFQAASRIIQGKKTFEIRSNIKGKFNNVTVNSALTANNKTQWSVVNTSCLQESNTGGDWMLLLIQHVSVMIKPPNHF